jgi:hypothetical protein
MGTNEWLEAESLLDTANKLVRQAKQILVRDNFSDSWYDELTCISGEIEDYLANYRHVWLEGNDG